MLSAMPELPEVETIRRGLAPKLQGRRLVRVVPRRPDLRRALPPDLADKVTGARVEAVDRRGKHLLLRLDNRLVLMLHLGMSGRLLLRQSGLAAYAPGRHDHILIESEDGWLVVFNDARRFGMVDLVMADAVNRHESLAELGPEPLSEAFDGRSLHKALRGRATPIKSALLDQRVVAGLGNIYACESLFLAGVSPRRLAAHVTPGRADRLAAAIKQVLRAAIAAGGSTLRDYVQADGELGYFQHAWAVYDREGQPCPGCSCRPAHGGIRRIVQAGRSTFYCSHRQR